MPTSADLVSGVNLAALPPVRFAPQDAAEVEAAVLTAYERLASVTLQPGDPVRLFLESLAYVVSVQNSQPGRDINPSQLIALVQAAGAKRVELTSPAFAALTETQVARETAVSLMFGGLEDA